MSDYPPPPPPPYPPPPPGSQSQPAGWAGPPLASWGERAGAFLVDAAVPLVILVGGLVVAAAMSALSDALWVLVLLLAYGASFAFVVWNLVQQGSTGQTIGKRTLGIRLLREADGRPVGAGLSIGRYLLHVVDQIPCYVGYLWPLWDRKRQTFADKIVGTVVVKG